MIKTKQTINLHDWDALVVRTYGRPYSFQQQDGCKDQGNFPITIPDEACDYENDTIPQEINGDEMRVSFAAWLARDPNEWKGSPKHYRDMFWERNFYPDVQMIENDLHAKDLIPAGTYDIEIDW